MTKERTSGHTSQSRIRLNSENSLLLKVIFTVVDRVTTPRIENDHLVAIELAPMHFVAARRTAVHRGRRRAFRIRQARREFSPFPPEIFE